MFDDSSWLTKSQEEAEGKKGVGRGEEEVGGGTNGGESLLLACYQCQSLPKPRHTHAHTLQSKLKPKNETATGNVVSAEQS